MRRRSTPVADTPPPVDRRVCLRCTHLADDHRMDDSGPPPTAPNPQFRCTQPGCTCPNLSTRGRRHQEGTTP